MDTLSDATGNAESMADLLAIINGERDIPDRVADKLVSMLIKSSHKGLFDAALIKAVERNRLTESNQRKAAAMGAAARQRQAEAREAEVVRLAGRLVSKRSRPYDSASSLARAIESESDGEYKYDYVRRLLNKHRFI